LNDLLIAVIWFNVIISDNRDLAHQYFHPKNGFRPFIYIFYSSVSLGNISLHIQYFFCHQL